MTQLYPNWRGGGASVPRTAASLHIPQAFSSVFTHLPTYVYFVESCLQINVSLMSCTIGDR